MAEIDTYQSPKGGGRIEIPGDIEVEELEQLLAYLGIPLDLWGRNEAKTVANLKNEIANGDSVMWFDLQGGLHRDVSVLWLDVIHEDSDGNVYILKEDRQEFKDGRKRVRELPGSLGEKLQPNESPEDGVARALSEEIGVDEFTAHYVLGEGSSEHAPSTYPGLVSNYTTYSHLVTIGEDVFRADGYVEYQADKTNYYVWEKIGLDG